MGGNKDDVGVGGGGIAVMFCGRNSGRGGEQWDTKCYQNYHFFLERKCKNVLAGFCDSRNDAP